jgi:hypothetical protein
MTLVDNEDAITPGIISKEVDIYQPLILNTQSSFFIHFSDDCVLGVFIGFRVTRGQVPAMLKGHTGSL